MEQSSGKCREIDFARPRQTKTPAVVPANAGTHTPQPTFGEDRP